MAKKTVYKTRWMRIEEEEFRDNKGKKFFFSRLVVPDVAVMLPVLDDGRIVLERQFRHAIKKWLYEIPAGMSGRGSSPEETAHRELEEETGYTAKSMKLMFKQYASPGNQLQLQYVYLATGLRKSGKIHFDSTERIKTKIVTMKQALRMMKTNEIDDGKTIAAVLFYKEFLKRR